MALYIPANLSRQELTDMLRSVPVDNGGTRTGLLNVAEDVRTGRLVLSARPAGTRLPGQVNLADHVPHYDLLQGRDIPPYLRGQDLKDALYSVKFTLDGVEGHDLLNCAARIGRGDIVLTGASHVSPVTPQPSQVAPEDSAPLFPHKTPQQLFAGDIPSMLHSSDVLAALRTVPVVVGSEPGNLLGVAGQLKSGNYHLILQPNFIEESAVRPAGSTDVDVTEDTVTVQRPGGRVTVTVDL